MATTLSSAKQQASSAVEEAGEALSREAAQAADKAKDVAAEAGRRAAELQDDIVKGAEDLAANVSDKLKAVGVDTEVMASAAKEQVSELQRLFADEVKARPFRAIGIAAAVGLVVGLLSAR